MGPILTSLSSKVVTTAVHIRGGNGDIDTWRRPERDTAGGWLCGDGGRVWNKATKRKTCLRQATGESRAELPL